MRISSIAGTVAAVIAIALAAPAYAHDRDDDDRDSRRINADAIYYNGKVITMEDVDGKRPATSAGTAMTTTMMTTTAASGTPAATPASCRPSQSRTGASSPRARTAR